ncbi:MAG: 3-deoxy-8-phosphooctulonate synthase [Acidobacteriota bacterium]|nr:3-deoxy-8-phosphooctulonate synthase [Acidobacteriota bacterium]
MTITSFNLVDGMLIGGGARPVYLAGPCVVESRDFVVDVAGRVGDIAARHGVPLVFKASYDKANRSSESSFRGPGVDEGLEALAEVKRVTGLPVITDVHHPEQAAAAAQVVDMLQVPAFLCRQTDLLHACSATGLPVNVKKGQFLAPEDMANAVEKVRSSGNDRVLLTERGSTFGYHNLVVDMRGLPIMRRFAPVIFDCTHSLQLPGGLGHSTGGAKEFHPFLARAAAAAGVDGFFIEVHPDPPNAMSDATTQLSFDEFDRLLEQLEAVSAVQREVAP